MISHAQRQSVFFFVSIIASFFLPYTARAANLYFSPSSGNYNVGQDFSVSVFVSSADQAMNAAQGVINFPSDRLQVTSLSKAGSIISLWVQEPSFTAGAVNFEGIVLNPGFTGNAGKVLTVNFKVKAAGSGTLSFTSGSVLANDGQGTNILSGLATANFSLLSSVAPDTEFSKPPVVTSNVPLAPTVTSPTHSDTEKWYTQNSPKFEWTLPRGTTGVNVLANKEPLTDPGTRSDGLMTSYTFNDVDDGVWYFHIKLQNKDGWGAVAHYPFRIDTENPYIQKIEFVEQKSTGESVIHIGAGDTGSGIAYYEIVLDQEDAVRWIDDGAHQYITDPLDPGVHHILVTAFDAAGNKSEVSEAVFESIGDALSVGEVAAPPTESKKQISVQASTLIVAIPGFLFLMVLLLFLVHVWKKLRDTKKHLRRRIRNVEASVHDAFVMLHTDMVKHLKLLESAKSKRALTREEEKILAQMKRDIEIAEKIVNREISDMKEEIE